MTSDQFSALSDSLFSASIIIYALAALAFGHRAGVNALKRTVEGAAELIRGALAAR